MSEYMGVIFMEEKISSGRLHRLVLSDRHTGSVTGVNDVVSFDENEIVLDTDMGLLTVRGKELHVKRLTLETVFLSTYLRTLRLFSIRF